MHKLGNKDPNFFFKLFCIGTYIAMSVQIQKVRLYIVKEGCWKTEEQFVSGQDQAPGPADKICLNLQIAGTD